MVEATKVGWLHGEFVMKVVQKLDVRKTGAVKDVPIETCIWVASTADRRLQGATVAFHREGP